MIPAMSVILISPSSFDNIRRAVACLRKQTVASRLEVLMAAPSTTNFGLREEEVSDFLSYRVIPVGEIRKVSTVKVEALHSAASSVVAFGEEHCFPHPTWAEALIRAHEGPYAVVGPEMHCANPGTMMARATHFLHYGYASPPALAGLVATVPWHNCSYKRDVLLRYGERLAGFLTVEGLLHQDLRLNGSGVYLEPAARTSHMSLSRTGPVLLHSFLGGRLFAATRARYENWPVARRLFYAACFPLVPTLRMARAFQEMRRSTYLTVSDLPGILLPLFVHASGEAAGYLSGVGDAEYRYVKYELQRLRYVTESDRREAEEATMPKQHEHRREGE